MNIAFLLKNIRQANISFPKFIDRIKFLFLIYRLKSKAITVLIRFKYGDVNLVIRSNDGSDIFITSEVFFRDDYDLPISPPQNIIDLGANCVYTSLYLAKKYPQAKIVAVEPVPQNIKQIQTHLVLNQLENQILLYPVAKRESDGVAYLQLHDKDYGHQVTDLPTDLEINKKSIATIL